MSSGGQYLPFIGPNYQAEQNLKHQEDVFDWQKSAQQTTWDREDTSVQRRVADLKSAGMSPVLAAGQGAQTSAPIQVTAPQKQIIDPTQQAMMVMSMLTQKADISRTYAQEKLLNQQVQQSASQNALNLANLLKTSAETDRIQRLTPEELRRVQSEAVRNHYSRHTTYTPVHLLSALQTHRYTATVVFCQFCSISIMKSAFIDC